MNIFFFGDSISFGQFIPPHLIWVNKLSEKLYLDNRLDKPKIMNCSVNGNTTRMALERLQYDVGCHGIDIIMIQFGMNDCNYWKTDKGLARVSPRSFEANLHEIIEKCKNFGAKLIFLGTNHPSTRDYKYDGLPFSYQDKNREYNQIIRKVAIDANVVLIDNEKHWQMHLNAGANLQDLVLQDEIHLSEKGHELYFEYIYPIYNSQLAIFRSGE